MEQQREFTFATGIGNGVTFLGVASETSTGFRVEMRTEARDVVAMSPGKIQTRYAVYRMLANWRDDKTPITVIGHGAPCACVVSCLTERHDGPDADVFTVELARTQPAAVGLVDAAFAQLGMPNIDPSGPAYQVVADAISRVERKLSDFARECASMIEQCFDESDAEYKARVTAGLGTAPWERPDEMVMTSSWAEIKVPASPMVSSTSNAADIARKVQCMFDKFNQHTDVQRAIACADATSANPGSREYMRVALLGLPGMSEADVYDCSTCPGVMLPMHVAVVVDGTPRFSDVADVIEQTRTAGVVTLGTEHVPGRPDVRWFTPQRWRAFLDPVQGAMELHTAKMDTHGKDIRPGTAVFTETCGRCGVSLRFTDAEDEAHKARCFAVGDYVRLTSLCDDNVWSEGTVTRLIGKPTMADRTIEFIVERTSTGRVPGDVGVGQFALVSSKVLRRCAKATQQVDADLEKLRGDIEREVLSVLMTDDGRSREPETNPETYNLANVSISFAGQEVVGYDATQSPLRDVNVSIGPPTSTNDPCVWKLDPLDVEYDEVTLRDLLAKDAAIRQDAPTNYKRSPLTPAQRAAVSVYHSAQLRERIAKAEVERKAREVSVVVGIDPEDL